MKRVIGFLLTFLTLFTMVMGFYLIYGLILMEATIWQTSELVFVAVDLIASIISTVVLLIAEVKWGA